MAVPERTARVVEGGAVLAGVPIAAPIAASGGSGVPVAAVLPLVLLGVAFVAYCLVDLARHDVRYLPKWAWVVICLASIPVGGIVYLIIGRDHR